MLRTFFGPPGYGENPKTDSRETQGVLLLERSICIDQNTDDFDPAETNQSEVTLVPINSVNLSSYVGKSVRVSGTLFHANTGHHHTAVLMELQSITRK